MNEQQTKLHGKLQDIFEGLGTVIANAESTPTGVGILALKALQHEIREAQNSVKEMVL